MFLRYPIKSGPPPGPPGPVTPPGIPLPTTLDRRRRGTEFPHYLRRKTTGPNCEGGLLALFDILTDGPSQGPGSRDK